MAATAAKASPGAGNGGNGGSVGSGSGGNNGGDASTSGGAGGNGGAGAGGNGGAGAGGNGGAGAGGNGGAGVGGGGTGGSGDSGGGTGGRGGSAGAAGAPGTKCTGKPGAPGLTTRSIGGHNVLVHIPSKVDPNTGVPLLLVHHGFLMDGEAMRTLTGYQAIADREGFVVAFPTGTGNTWNVGSGACGGAALVSGTADDVTFVNTMISSIEAVQCLSRDHVFMTGFSMGAYFSNHMGCQMNNAIRAIAPHSGGTYPGSCPGAPTPVMIWHGTADGTVPQMQPHRTGCLGCAERVPAHLRHRAGDQWDLRVAQGLPAGRTGGALHDEQYEPPVVRRRRPDRCARLRERQRDDLEVLQGTIRALIAGATGGSFGKIRGVRFAPRIFREDSS